MLGRAALRCCRCCGLGARAGGAHAGALGQAAGHEGGHGDGGGAQGAGRGAAMRRHRRRRSCSAPLTSTDHPTCTAHTLCRPQPAIAGGWGSKTALPARLSVCRPAQPPTRPPARSHLPPFQSMCAAQVAAKYADLLQAMQEYEHIIVSDWCSMVSQDGCNWQGKHWRRQQRCRFAPGAPLPLPLRRGRPQLPSHCPPPRRWRPPATRS